MCLTLFHQIYSQLQYEDKYKCFIATKWQEPATRIHTSTLSLWANSTKAYFALPKAAFFFLCFSIVTAVMAPHFLE